LSPQLSIHPLATPLVATPMDSFCLACVIIPVRNEEERVGNALKALASQVDLAGSPLDPGTFEILVLLNNCSDQSSDIVRDFARTHPALRLHAVEKHLPRSCANIGYVRRLLMEEASSRFTAIGHPGGAILSTDADSCASPEWIAASLDELARGLDAIGGRISLHEAEYRGLAPDLRRDYLRDLRYGRLVAELESLLDPIPCDPWPRHHQHFGASLGVKASAYRKAGGIPEVEYLEDVALWQALLRTDARLRHSPRIRVRTSARLHGRVAVGLSSHLRAFTSAQSAPGPIVDSAEWLEMFLRMRRKLRVRWIATHHNDGPFGLMLERVNFPSVLGPKWSSERRYSLIDVAISDLQRLIARSRSRSAKPERLTPSSESDSALLTSVPRCD
jgi:hypothetical protein